MPPAWTPARNRCHFHWRPAKLGGGKCSRLVFRPPCPLAPAPPAPVKSGLSAPDPAAPAILAIFRKRAGSVVSPPPASANRQSPRPRVPPNPPPPTASPVAARQTKPIPVTAASIRHRRAPCRIPLVRCLPPLPE